MCLILLNDVIIIVIFIVTIIIIIIIIMNIKTSLFCKYWFLIELINRILYSGTSPLGHLTPPFRGHKIWPWMNIHILIFLSHTPVEGTLFPYPRFNLHSGDTLVLNVSLTTKRVDKLMFTLITMIRAFITWTISLKSMYCSCRNNNATICQSKVNCDLLFSCLKNDTRNRFQGRN